MHKLLNFDSLATNTFIYQYIHLEVGRSFTERKSQILGEELFKQFIHFVAVGVFPADEGLAM